jgi:hypothetical protein
MKTVRLLFASFLLAAAALPIACTSTVTPQSKGGACDYDQQCDSKQGLVCRCAIVKVPDDEGPDQIIRDGVCDLPTAPCPGDGGVEAGDGATEASTDASVDSAPTDVAGGVIADGTASDGASADAADAGSEASSADASDALEGGSDSAADGSDAAADGG